MTGYENPRYNALVTPATGDDAWMCHAQITKSSDYASYNVLYIVLILVVGALIIIGSYVVPSAMNRLRERSKCDPIRWDNTDLQSLVEQVDYGQRQQGTVRQGVAVGARGTEQSYPLLPI